MSLNFCAITCLCCGFSFSDVEIINGSEVGRGVDGVNGVQDGQGGDDRVGGRGLLQRRNSSTSSRNGAVDGEESGKEGVVGEAKVLLVHDL